jgi:hypothetical protein
MGKRIRRDELTSLMLTMDDRDLILAHTRVDGELRARVEMAIKASAERILIRLTPDDLNELLEWIAAAANHAEDRSLESTLDALYDRVRCVEDSLDVYET